MNEYEILINECDKSITLYTQKLHQLKNDCDNGIEFVNFKSIIIISLIDLSVVLKNICLAKTDWEKIFFIKHGYLIIFETIKKLRPENRVPHIQNIIESRYLFLKSSYHDVLSDIDNFKSDPVYTKIINTRNYIAAHIEWKYNEYYKTAFSLCGEETGQTIIKLLPILQKMNQIAIHLC